VRPPYEVRSVDAPGLGWPGLAVTRLLAILALALPFALALPAEAGAQVTNQNDSGPGSLRAALANAAADPIIDVPAGTYRLTSQLQLPVPAGVSVTLRGAGAGATIIQATGAFRVLCILGNATDVTTIDALTIQGGRVGASSPGCGGSQGGGGISAVGSLSVTNSIVRDNSATVSVLGADGGGGIRWDGTGAFDVSASTISGNSATVAGPGSGGGGIYSGGPPALTNVTLSGNRHLAGNPGTSGGGGGIFAAAGGGAIEQVTFAGNHSARDGGAIGSGAATATTLTNSLFDKNTAVNGPGCAPLAVLTSNGGNLESTANSCDLGSDDRAGVDPQLGPLALNGSSNGTLTHELLARTSPAVELGPTCNVPLDQRGVSRSDFGTCDSGAYEFDGRSVASVPTCSPTGVIPLSLDAPPGGTVVGVKYSVNGEPTIEKQTGDTGGTLTPTSVTLPEGRNTLEYWGWWTNGDEQGHGRRPSLVDKTDPTVSVENNQQFSVFVITRRATVDVSAADALSGLTINPSANAVRLATGKRGATTFSSTAADLCTNRASDSLDYRVLAPGLGRRTVLERVKGKVRVRRPGAAASIAQKGQPFSALTVPRELPVRSFIDSRRGTTRLTTARTRREDQIQDGLFSAGVFQVLQSRRRRAKGLTTVRLKGGSFKRCGARRRGKRSSAGAARLSRRTIRRLRGRARGRFRTRGRHSAATVRGTVWITADRCDGTLTKVIRGRVSVRDFTRHKTVTVRAGRSYLARAPRR
jgi:hypothetical protein